MNCKPDNTKTVDGNVFSYQCSLYLPQTIEKYIKDNLMADFDISKLDCKKSEFWSEADGMFSIAQFEAGGGFFGSLRKEPITLFPENAAVKEIVLKGGCVILSKNASEIPEWFKTANDLHKSLCGEELANIYLDPHNTRWGMENGDMGKRMFIQTGYEQGNMSHMRYSAKYTFGGRGKGDIISCIRENTFEVNMDNPANQYSVTNCSTHIEDGLMLKIYDCKETKYDGGTGKNTVSYTLNYQTISENEYKSAAAVKLFDENAAVMISNYDNSEHSFKEMMIGEFYEIAKMITE